MRLSGFRPRYSIRWMMASVAIAAIMIGIERLHERRIAFLRIASEHARLEERARMLGSSMWDSASFNEAEGYIDAGKSWRRKATDQFAQAISRGSKKRKYEWAARYPWLPVEPDLPRLK